MTNQPRDRKAQVFADVDQGFVGKGGREGGREGGRREGKREGKGGEGKGGERRGGEGRGGEGRTDIWTERRTNRWKVGWIGGRME